MPLRTSEGDGKGTGRGRRGWPVVGGRMGRERRMCRRKVEIEMVPNGHPPLSPQSRRRSQRKACLLLGQHLAAAEPHPAPHGDGLSRQVSATTGIPDLDSVSFCTFLPRYLSGLLGQANSFRPMLHPTCPPAMDASPSSLRLLFPAPLCSEAWNLNFLHFPIYTLLVCFFFSSSQYVNRKYCLFFILFCCGACLHVHLHIWTTCLVPSPGIPSPPPPPCRRKGRNLPRPRADPRPPPDPARTSLRLLTAQLTPSRRHLRRPTPIRTGRGLGTGESRRIAEYGRIGKAKRAISTLKIWKPSQGPFPKPRPDGIRSRYLGASLSLPGPPPLSPSRSSEAFLLGLPSYQR